MRELRNVGIGIGALFGALFVSTTIIQVFAVDELRVDPRNVRTLYDSYSTERGAILVGSFSGRPPDTPDRPPRRRGPGLWTLERGAHGRSLAGNIGGW